MSYRLLQGDAQEVLETLEPQSVHCVVTSPPLVDAGGVQALAPFPQFLTPGDVLIGEALTLDNTNSAVLVRERSRTRNFRAVTPAIGLKRSKLKNGLCAAALDLQVWQEGAECLLGVFVRRLPAVERPSLVCVGLLTVVRSAETLGQKLYGRFVNHAHLYAGVIAGSLALLAGVSPVSLDADVSFSVNQSSAVSDINLSHIYLTCDTYDIITERRHFWATSS